MDTSALDVPCRIDFGAAAAAEDKVRESIPVYLRIRPTEDEDLSIKVIDATTVETNHAGRANKKATFTHIFSGVVSQEEVFNVTTAPLVDKFLDGANVMTFAYGVTSSGKTYTIMGGHTNPGVIPRTLEKIFGSYRSKIANSSLVYRPTLFDGVQELSMADISELERTKSSLLAKTKGSHLGFDQYAFANTTLDLSKSRSLSAPGADSCSVWISVYEIYNEVITDLLDVSPRNKRKGLMIGQDAKNRTYVKDLIQIPVSSAAEAFGLLQVAKQSLAKAATKLNDTSSRSHMVFVVKMVHWGAALAEPLVNQFVISDLAGSERQSKTGSSGVVLKQAGAINSSLLVLGRCLEALRKKDKCMPAPVRDSKLTRMLNPFFTLGGYVSLIICINPHVHLQDETMDTIRFSAIASEIVQAPERPLDRLRQLRRLTQGCIENSPLKVTAGGDESDEVENWQDAVRQRTVRHGIAYIEIKASYFRNMASDILKAEKMMQANEDEIARLKALVKDLEESKVNIGHMYQDRIREQREKFLKEKAELRALYEDDNKDIVEELSEEIQTFKNKYTKYRDGYAKLQGYLTEKLWPEIGLYRERFGYLPEFPPKEGTTEGDDKERVVRPENTIGYWQDKLQEKCDEVRGLKKTIQQETELVAQLKAELSDAERMRECTEKQIAEAQLLAAEKRELEEQVRSLKVDLADRETLLDEVHRLNEMIRQSEEDHEAFLAETQINIHRLQEELEGIKAELREKDSDLEKALAEHDTMEAHVQRLNETIARLEEQLASNGGELSLLQQTNAEKAMLCEQVAALEKELAAARMEAVAACADTLTMQDRIIEFEEREIEIAQRETEEAIRRRELRKSRKSNEHTESAFEELRMLRERLAEQSESFAEQNVLLQAQAAELEDLRDKVATFDVLASQLKKVSEENREFRDRVRRLEGENSRLEYEVKQTRALEVEVEFLSRKLENQQRRVLKDASQTDTSARHSRRSTSVPEITEACERLDLTQASRPEKPRRRLRLEDEENVLDKTLEGPIRDLSPLPLPYRTRSSKKKVISH